ncbi:MULTISPECIES: hypothetical protein [unclassified Bradyrhizobium]
MSSVGDDIRSALRQAFPVRTFALADGGSVVALETPEPQERGGPAVRRLLLVGLCGDGYPIAMELPAAEGRQVTQEFVQQTVTSESYREMFDREFGRILGGLGDKESWCMTQGGGLLEWLARNFGRGRSSEFWDAAFFHVNGHSQLRDQICGLTGVRNRPTFDFEMSALQWQRLYGADGPDGRQTWIAKLRTEWSVFAKSINEAIRQPNCLMREELTPQHNVLLALGIPAAAPAAELRRLSKLVERIKPHWELAEGANDLFAMLRDCPEDWWPADRLAWKAAWRIGEAARVLQVSLHLPMRQLVSPSKGRWEGWADALARVDPLFEPDEAGGTSGVDLKAGARNVRDFIWAFTAQVYYPLKVLNSDSVSANVRRDFEFTYLQDREAIARVLFGEASMAGILENSVKWHLTRAKLEGKLAKVSPQFSKDRVWRAGLPRQEMVVDGRRFEIMPLTSQQMLADEGASGVDANGMRGLDHCVGGLNYVVASLEGHCRIVSIREIMTDGSRVRRSTAEFRYRAPDINGDARYMMLQHRGRANRTPEDAAWDVLWAYQRGLVGVRGQPRLEVDHAGLKPVEEQLSVSAIAGYDVEKPAHIEAVLRLWEPLLSRPLRGLDLDEFAEACGVGAPKAKLAGMAP